MTAAEYFFEGTIDSVSFGSFLDLARLRMGGASAETCDACNTLNLQHACVCKCCAHRLPAFYGLRGRSRERNDCSKVPRRKLRVLAGPRWAALATTLCFLIDALKVVGAQSILVMGPAAKGPSK
ncbi:MULTISPECIES: hypothetical protein [unclassified Variovorax]|uniref:hypothetical protein n=1 Tax=unclassified Variovorax TaxID=663243 RepID=UPI001BD40CF6|nr:MULTISPECIES: hypothetical protein [unclassified Variovorax]